MRPRTILGAALLAVAVSLGVTWGVNAYRTASPYDPLAELDLSPAQRAAVGAEFRSFHPRLLSLQGKVDGKRAELARLLAEGEPDQVEACLGEVAALEAALDHEVARSLLTLKPHLSPEQQLRLFRLIQLKHPVPEARR
jgi:Spy/CpxP family protein refolding chaperone